MKRSKSINLSLMKKGAAAFRPRPLAIGIAAAVSVLSGCSNNSQNQGEIFQTLADCQNKYPQAAQHCDSAYQKAVQDARETSPKYAKLNECERDFGAGQCTDYQRGGTSLFMPLMAGFIVGRMLDDAGNAYRYGGHSAPLFTSYSSSSPYYYRWTTADGYSYGNYRTGRVKVNRQTFEPKPKVTKTIKRGGFGSKVAAKSKWGGGAKSRSGWGG